MTYSKRELAHTGFAVAVTVLVAVASELAGIQGFEEVSLTGLAVTATRSLATAVVTLGSRYVVARRDAGEVTGPRAPSA